MSDPLLDYYKKELAFLRNSGVDFAETYPDAAAYLRLGPDQSRDPHVERLIEGFAYLTARIRRKLDDDFPELTDALLNVLYPHFLAPMPSMAIAQFNLAPGQEDLVAGLLLPRHTSVDAQAPSGDTCRFRTCYPTTLFPVRVASAALTRTALPSRAGEGAPKPTGSIRISLQCLSKDISFKNLELSRLRFYIHGQKQHAFPLHELIFNGVTDVIVMAPGGAHRFLKPSALMSVGFGPQEAMLPSDARSMPGYRLMSEYFTFRNKFLFFDLELDRRTLADIGNKFDICINVTQVSGDLERNINADTFRLGCAPIINLYDTHAEPIRLTQAESEYRIETDTRRPLSTEIYSVNKVTATPPRGDPVTFAPFYAFKHAKDAARQTTFWFASHRQATRRDGKIDPGTEVYLSLVDLGFSPSVPADWTLDIETTCLNRDLPENLPFGGGQPVLQLSDGGPVVVACLTQPAPTIRPGLKRGAMWRVVSHLNLNYLSLVGGDVGGAALREILGVYDLFDSPETQAKIASIEAVSSRRIVGRTLDGVCRGLEVNIRFDPARFSDDNGLFLFTAMLERFLGYYCSVNSFSQLVATTNRGVLKQWPSRAGEKILL